MHLQRLDTGLAFVEAGQMRIVFPQGGGRGAHVGLKPAGRGSVQIPDCCREHDNVPRTLKGPQDKALHSGHASMGGSFARIVIGTTGTAGQSLSGLANGTFAVQGTGKDLDLDMSPAAGTRLLAPYAATVTTGNAARHSGNDP